MIRIDEIYCNVFLPTVQDRKGVALHWFDPFGSVDFDHICNLPPVNGPAKLRVIFWDQEPVYRDTISKFMQKFSSQYFGPCMLVTSEKNSQDLEWARSTYGMDACYYFFHGWAALDWYRGYNHSFLAPSWHKRKFQHRIFCPNNIISGRRHHRVELVSAMSHQGLLEKNLVSLPSECPFSGETVSDICHKLAIAPPAEKLPLIIDRNINHAHDSHRIDFWSQATGSFCHVVTETIYDDHRLHLTEKIFKPIVMQQPFVVVGSRGSLEYLKSYGFKTFDQIWDESYDGLPSQDRMRAILALLHKINSWSQQELMEAQREISQTIKHNHDWFYGDFQHLLWQELTDMIGAWR